MLYYGYFLITLLNPTVPSYNPDPTTTLTLPPLLTPL